MPNAAVVNFEAKPYSVELRDIELPRIHSDEVLVEVKAVGVCGSDLHQWTAEHSWPVSYPVVLGHEFSGVVSDIGTSVSHWAKGDRVVSETAAIIDYNNPMTRQGLYNLDPSRKGFGYGVNGAMTRYVGVPARCLHLIPPKVSFDNAALTEPLCVAFSAAIMNTNIRLGDRIIVYGPGPIGLMCAAMARLSGAEVGVVGIEHDKPRLAVAEQYGCTPILLDARDWANQGDGLGVDGVIDAAGVSNTLSQAMDIVRPNGWISKVGWGPEPLGCSLDPLVQKGIRLQGSFSHTWATWERVLRLLGEDLLNLSPLLIKHWSLEDWHEAFESMSSGTIVKAILHPA